MHTITKLAQKFSAYSHLLTSGALIFSFLPIPFLKPPIILSPVKDNAAAALSAPAPAPTISLVETFFGAGTSEKVSEPIINKQINLVSTRKAFPASLSVIKKHEATILEAAAKHGVPADVAIGVSLLENGGSETAVSSAGALGVFQLMPGTARSLGLTVNKTLDERRDVEKNIDAGVAYLKMNYERFGDWGLATWAYHAGEGNVAKALKLYAKANDGTHLVGLKEQSKLKAYVEKKDITIHKLLSSAAVKPMTKKLADDSSGYPYKVIATAALFRTTSGQALIIPGSVAEKR